MRFKTETLSNDKEHRFIARLVDPMIWYIPDSTIQSIRNWCDEQGVHCCQVQSQFFFKDEDDRLLFMLRWHQ
jgi:hypothetical protein